MYWEGVVKKVMGCGEKFAFANDRVFGRNFEIELHEWICTGIAL
jgi:hypothetical protein